MCRVITVIRQYTMEGVLDANTDLWKKAGLSVHSFLDASQVREEVKKMVRAKKRARAKDENSR